MGGQILANTEVGSARRRPGGEKKKVREKRRKRKRVKTKCHYYLTEFSQGGAQYMPAEKTPAPESKKEKRSPQTLPLRRPPRPTKKGT